MDSVGVLEKNCFEGDINKVRIVMYKDWPVDRMFVAKDPIGHETRKEETHNCQFQMTDLLLPIELRSEDRITGIRESK